MPVSATPVHPSEAPATDLQTSPASPHLRAVRERSLEVLDEILQDKTQPARERLLAAASLLRYAAAIETLELRLADRAAERAERAQRDADPDDNTDDDSYEDEPLDDDDAQDEDEDEEDDDFGPPPNPCPDDMITMQARDPAREAHLHQALRTAHDLLNRQAHTTGLGGTGVPPVHSAQGPIGPPQPP